MYRHAGRLLRRAAAVITVSSFSKASICGAYEVDSDRVHVIPNGLDHGRFKPAAGVEGPDEAPYLMYVGGHTPRKNVGRLIEAFADARQRLGSGDLRLVLVGPVAHAESRLRAAAPPTLPHDALDFAGYLDDDTLADRYQRAIALAVPSLYEGFGMPVTEAMASGTRVVVADGSALRDVAGGAATLVDPTDVRSISNGIVEVVTEAPDTRAEWVRRGIKRAASFSWETAAAQTLSLYDHIASNS